MASALPPNWSRYTTEDGKEYFHNSETNTTQWERPDGGVGLPESLSFQSSTSEVYQYKPQDADLELQPRPGPTAANLEGGKMVGMMHSPSPVVPPQTEAVGVTAPGGKIPTFDGAEGGGSGAANFGGFGSTVGGVISAATSDEGPGMSGMLGSLLTYSQAFFNVSSDDVVRRLRVAVLPYPPQPSGAMMDFKARPDFYGPFWVSTTAMLFFAATGNFARLIASPDHDEFKADYGLVRLSAGMIYGFLIGIPVAIRGMLWCLGQDLNSVNFQQMVCVYGYSFTPSIPASVLCLIPLESIRWLAVLSGCICSLLFLRENLLADIAMEAPTLKWKMAAVFILAQVVIFFVYRIHFFDANP